MAITKVTQQIRCRRLSPLVVMIAAASVQSVSAQQHNLSPGYAVDTLTEVTAVVEVSGELKSNAAGNQVTRTAFQVIGHLNYHEKFLDVDNRSTPTRAARHYLKAGAEIHMNRTTIAPELPEDRRLVAAHRRDSGEILLFAPGGQLTREQLDLVDVPASSLTLDGLQPDAPVAIGDTWRPTPERLARLLGLDAVARADVTSKLERIESGVAVVHTSGTVEGAIHGAASEMHLEAKSNIDTDTRRVTWLAMSVKENRAIGHAEPGLEATARIRIQVKPLGTSAPIAAAEQAGVSFKLETGSELLDHVSHPGGFRVIHDRRWHVMLDREDVTVWRFVDRGQLVAQANFSRLADLPAGKKLELAAFQENVRQALGENFRQFVEATDDTDNGLRALRVVAHGLAADVPITWVYYHVSDADGRRLAIVFTLESSLLEQFSEADVALVSSIQLETLPPARTAERPSDGGP